MFLADAIFALGIAFFLTVLFVGLGRCVRSWRRIIVFFAIVFLGSWAGGVWVTQIGPRILGLYWLSFVAAGLIFALVQGALSTRPSRSARCQRPEETPGKVEQRIEGVFNVFLFILLSLFIAAIVIGYAFRRPR